MLAVKLWPTPLPLCPAAILTKVSLKFPYSITSGSPLLPIRAFNAAPYQSQGHWLESWRWGLSLVAMLRNLALTVAQASVSSTCPFLSLTSKHNATLWQYQFSHLHHLFRVLLAVLHYSTTTLLTTQPLHCHNFSLQSGADHGSLHLAWAASDHELRWTKAERQTDSKTKRQNNEKTIIRTQRASMARKKDEQSKKN